MPPDGRLSAMVSWFVGMDNNGQRSMVERLWSRDLGEFFRFRLTMNCGEDLGIWGKKLFNLFIIDLIYFGGTI